MKRSGSVGKGHLTSGVNYTLWVALAGDPTDLAAESFIGAVRIGSVTLG